jgi:CspA family cold shock protein
MLALAGIAAIFCRCRDDPAAANPAIPWLTLRWTFPAKRASVVVTDSEPGRLVDDLVDRGLHRPAFLIVDGAPGLEKAIAAVWDGALIASGREKRMARGTVKWFTSTKGYGFIQPQGGGGGKDVFVHISAVERAGLSSLNEGQIVEYEIESNRGKESATNLKV